MLTISKNSHYTKYSVSGEFYTAYLARCMTIGYSRVKVYIAKLAVIVYSVCRIIYTEAQQYLMYK